MFNDIDIFRLYYLLFEIVCSSILFIFNNMFRQLLHIQVYRALSDGAWMERLRSKIQMSKTKDKNSILMNK